MSCYKRERKVTKKRNKYCTEWSLHNYFGFFLIIKREEIFFLVSVKGTRGDYETIQPTLCPFDKNKNNSPYLYLLFFSFFMNEWAKTHVGKPLSKDTYPISALVFLYFSVFVSFFFYTICFCVFGHVTHIPSHLIFFYLSLFSLK